MEVYHGNGKTEYGTGVQIDLTGNEVAMAIHTYLVAHDVHVRGAATIRVNGELCKDGGVYVDPSGFVVENGKKWSGRGTKAVLPVVSKRYMVNIRDKEGVPTSVNLSADNSNDAAAKVIRKYGWEYSIIKVYELFNV
jgi:hypothetical protein